MFNSKAKQHSKTERRRKTSVESLEKNDYDDYDVLLNKFEENSIVPAFIKDSTCVAVDFVQ